MFPFAFWLLLTVVFSTSLIASENSKSKIHAAILEKDNQKLGTYIRKYLDRKISFDALLKIAEDEHAWQLARSLRAAYNLHPKSNQLGVRRALLAEAAFFVETELPRIVKKKKYYVPAVKSGLACDVEYDPKTKNSFIHLAGKKGTKVGSGWYKTVTKSILYKADRAEIVARAKQKVAKPREMELSEKLGNIKGIVRTYAVTSYKEHGKVKYNIITRLYQPGCLHKVFEQNMKFTLREKMHIAHSLLDGLYQMHSRKIVHRDLGARNYFIDIQKNRPKGHRKITPVIADLGRAEYVAVANKEKAQGNTAYTAPEGLYFTRMKGKDYYATDVYALGCLLYQFFYEKRGPWVNSRYIKERDRPVNHRYIELVKMLNKYRKARADKLLHKKTSSLSAKERFERLILKMIDPLPKKRGTTKELKKEMEQILALKK